MSAVSVPVQGGIPPLPAGAVVHQRGDSPAPAPAPAPAAMQPVPPQPAAQPQAPAAPVVDQQLLELLSALKTTPQAPAQPEAAPTPVQPIQAPEAGQDPVIASLQAVIVDGGLDYNRALGRAMESGDPSLIDYAYIAEKGGAKAAHLKQVAEGLVAHQEATDARLEQAVFTKFGGESNFDAALSFFAKTAPKTTTDYLVGMLKTRNPALIEQASNMVLDYVKQSGAHLNPAATVHGAGAGIGEHPLGKDEFKREIAKLKPNDPGFEQARQQLFVRRHQGKQLGR